MQVHGRKGTYTTPQPFVSANLPSDEQWTVRMGERTLVKTLQIWHAFKSSLQMLCRSTLQLQLGI